MQHAADPVDVALHRTPVEADLLLEGGDGIRCCGLAQDRLGEISGSRATEAEIRAETTKSVRHRAPDAATPSGGWRSSDENLLKSHGHVGSWDQLRRRQIRLAAA
jgi:hypothetical protein